MSPPPPPPPPPFFFFSFLIIIINILNLKKNRGIKPSVHFFFGCKKIADDMKPNPMVTTVLTKLCKIIPTWKLIPTKDVVEMAFKEPEKRDEVCFLPNLSNPILFEIFGSKASNNPKFTNPTFFRIYIFLK